MSLQPHVNKGYISRGSGARERKKPQQHVLVRSTHPFFYAFNQCLHSYHAHVKRARVYSSELQ